MLTGACLCLAIAAGWARTVSYAGNNPDLSDRGAGYYSMEVAEYPELSVIYEGKGEPDTMSAYQDKRAAAEASEDAADIKINTDTLFVSSHDYELETVRIIVTHVLLADPQSQIKAGLSNDTFGGEREKPSDYAQRTGARVVINGSYFYYETGQPIESCAPVVLNEGNILRDGETNGSEICLRYDGSFFSPHPGMYFDGQLLLDLGVVSNFGTADPLLIADGIPMSFPDGVTDGVHPRSAIGVVCPGDYYIITAGRDGSYDGGMTYRQMQSVFYHLGCSYARSLDGGGSAALVIDGGLQNVPAEGEERAVVDFLAFYD